jgi:hypothetical protein
MFVGDEVLVAAGFDAAKSGLIGLARGGGLVSISEAAYAEAVAGLVRPGAREYGPVKPRLAGVRLHDLAGSDGWAGLALRWEAIGPGGLFAVLDADMKLARAGEHATVLTLAGAYRPPADLVAAGLDRVSADPVATATVGVFVRRVADAICLPPLARADGEGVR